MSKLWKSIIHIFFIDEADRELACDYGLIHKELDFIINYDVKYRMGASAGEEEDE